MRTILRGILLTTVMVLVALSVSAKNNRKFDKLINKFDVIEHIQSLESNRPDLFWEAVWKNNESLNKLYDAINEKKSVAEAAQKDLYEAYLFSAGYYNNLPLSVEYQFVADSLLKWICVKPIFEDAEFYIIESDEINAFACPDGRVYVTTASIMCEDINVEGMLGICAHETAHFLLQHSLAEAYTSRKRERRNKILAGVVSAVSVAANAMRRPTERQETNRGIT